MTKVWGSGIFAVIAEASRVIELGLEMGFACKTIRVFTMVACATPILSDWDGEDF